MARLVVTMTDDLESIKGVDLVKMVAEMNEAMGRIGTTEQDIIIITRGTKEMVPVPAEVDVIIDFFIFRSTITGGKL